MSIKDFFLAITPSPVLKLLNRLGWYVPNDIPEVPVVEEPFEQQRGSTNASVRDLFLNKHDNLEAVAQTIKHNKEEYDKYKKSLEQTRRAKPVEPASLFELLKRFSFSFSCFNTDVWVGPSVASSQHASGRHPKR